MTQATTWNLKTHYYDRAIEISEQCGISVVLAQLLINREIDSSDDVLAFLNPSLDELYSPWLLPDMDKAVNLITEAISKQKSVLIYGDYDADGVTATALLYDLFASLGLQVNYYIPDRFQDGYGLTSKGISKALKKFPSTDLIVTVDCGISSIQEISDLVEQGIQVVVTDHHEQLADLPAAHAVVNPKINSSPYPFSQLSGVAVALKLGQAIEQSLLQDKYDRDQILSRYLDLVTVGTVADLVPLLDENRYLVAHGLSQISQNRVGLQALLDVLGLSAQEITAGQVGFLLAPRINAAGRLASAEEAVDLLVTKDREKAEQLAAELDRDNRERQQVEREITQEAEHMIVSHNLQDKDFVFVVWNKDWHEGVIGIVASRILEKYHRPVVVLTEDKESGFVKGSCRSIPGFHIAKALNSCQDLLEKYGGHELAAGLTLRKSNIGELADRLNQIASEHLLPEDLMPSVNVDLLVPAETLCQEIVEEIELMEPFGIGNPRPVMGCSNIQLSSIRTVGKEKNHLQLQFKGENHLNINAIWFQGVEHKSFDKLTTGAYANIAFTPKISNYNGKNAKQSKNLDLQIKDMQLSDFSSGALYDYRCYDKRKSIAEIVDQDKNYIVLVNNNHRKAKVQKLLPQAQIYRMSDNPLIVLPSANQNTLGELLIFDLPYDAELIRQWVERTNSTAVYLLYNKRDKSLNDYMWKTAIPTVEVLALSWEIIKNLESQEGVFTIEELKKHLEQHCTFSVTNRLVQKCVQILVELQMLLATDSGYSMTDCQLKTDLSEEVDTELPTSYITEKNRYVELEKWEKLFLQGSGSALSLLLFHREIPADLIRSYLM